MIPSSHVCRFTTRLAAATGLVLIAASAGFAQLKPDPEALSAASPELVRRLREWWIHSWDPSYREVCLHDIPSVQDLASMVYDAGIQLGAGGLLDYQGPQADARKRALASLARLEPRIRQETSRLVEQLLLGWQELRRY